MAITTFHKFILVAGKHDRLLVDLCAEQGVISRTKLLDYMERHLVAPSEKDKLIDQLCRASILYEESGYRFTVNPVVADLVNFYERRGRLTNAEFLRDQIFEIGKLTDVLQQHLFEEPPAPELIADTVDKLFRVVRQVRESGHQHYLACMRAFGDMKRNSEEKQIDKRIEALKTVHRRYIEPLRELIDPDAEPVQKITMLRRRMADLGTKTDLLNESVELDTLRARLNIDIQYVDYTLIRHFETLIDTSRALFNSLIEEKNIKDALACCLGRMDAMWTQLDAATVLAPGLLSFQAAGLAKTGTFFSDVVHKKFVPRPRPMKITPAGRVRADQLLIFKKMILDSIRQHKQIAGWPEYVARRFASYPAAERLKAVALPLIMYQPPFTVRSVPATYLGDWDEFTVELTDFDVIWEQDHVI